MPIYAYRCDDCGFAKDVLQKISDAPLTECPSCGKPSFKKQLTAAGFQLKGTGWYVTDFRNNGSAPASPATSSASTNTGAGADAGTGTSSGTGASNGNGEAAKSVNSAESSATSATSAAPAAGGTTPSAV